MDPMMRDYVYQRQDDSASPSQAVRPWEEAEPPLPEIWENYPHNELRQVQE